MKRWTFNARLFRPEGPRMMTVLPIPAEVAKAGSFRARERVKGRVDDVVVATSLQSSGEGWLAFVVNKDLLAKLGRTAGDTVSVSLEHDNSPATVAIPAALQEALDKEPLAKETFLGLAPSRQKEYARWIESAKREETAGRRVGDAVRMLREGRKLR